MRAFTLIELLVVVAIVALLVGIALPSLAGARNAAWQAQCLARLRDVSAAMQHYAHNNREQLPAGFDELDYPESPCPADRRGDRLPGLQGSYEFHVIRELPVGVWVPPLAVREAYANESSDRGLLVSDLLEWHPVTHDVNARPFGGWMNGGYFDGSARRIER